MSQRAADELEQRRGLTLGLTLAEVLLLLLFIVLLALSWRMTALQREADDQRHRAQTLTEQASEFEAARSALAALLAELKAKGGLDAATVQDLAARLSRLAALEKDNSNLKQEVNKLTITLGSLRAVGADLAKLKLVIDALAAATEINPNDPAEFLKRSVDVMKVLGTQTKPEELKSLSEMTTDRNNLKALEKAIALGFQINPSDPAEALTRAALVLRHVGRDATPEQVLTLEQQTALMQERDEARKQLKGISGNGLTHDSCWKTSDGKVEYLFDVTIQDNGLIVREATPGRANDPAMNLVKGVVRNEMISGDSFTRETRDVRKYGDEHNCVFYSKIRDATGPMSKAAYKKLRTVVESHFYPLLLSTPWTDQTVGGPFVAPPRR